MNMYDVNIEKGVSIPNRGRDASPIKYPWGKMDMGDSFFIPLSGAKLTSIRVGISIDLKKYNSENGKKISITTRVEKDGVRVWRIK